MILKCNESNILVTGGAGFMGSNFIRYMLSHPGFTGQIVNVDALTYAASAQNVEIGDARYSFFRLDIHEGEAIESICKDFAIDLIVHFAAETHVDRSIEDPLIFTKTNVLGTQSLLEVVRKNPDIHFHHISTDEVYGSVGPKEKAAENAIYAPNSPYSASKAASDHLVRAYGKTYGISTTISHSTNNFGPGQFPEKLIPLTIKRCLDRQPIPIYGDGLQMRDWLFVDDHSRAIYRLLERGERGEVYNVGSGRHMTNLFVVQSIISRLAEKLQVPEKELSSLISFVTDRPGHDFCYSLDTTKMQYAIGWIPLLDFSEGIDKTLVYYEDSLHHTRQT